MNIFEFINTILENVMNDLGAFAPILACFLIISESIFPILPLSLFITVNAYYTWVYNKLYFYMYRMLYFIFILFKQIKKSLL